MLLLRVINLAPLWFIVAAVLVSMELYSVGLMLFSRQRWGVDRLKLNNEVAGFKFSVIGVLYAVLLAFVVIAVWENYNKTELTVRNEAKAIGDLMQLSHALPEPEGSLIRNSLIDYTNHVRDSEWATMARGLPSKPTGDALAHLVEAILDIPTNQFKDLALFQQALKLLAEIEDNRNERLESADGSVPAMLWFVLIAGALITLGYPAFFATSSLIAQTLMTGALAALVALALIPALFLDFPFTSEVAISPDPFGVALNRIPPHLKGQELFIAPQSRP